MSDKLNETLEEIFNFKSDNIPIKDYFSKEYEQLKEAIIKSIKYDDLMKASHEVVQNNISLTQLHQENKQLKEELKSSLILLNNTSQTAGNFKSKLDKIKKLCYYVDPDYGAGIDLQSDINKILNDNTS